jgi:hypothetical protein
MSNEALTTSSWRWQQKTLDEFGQPIVMIYSALANAQSQTTFTKKPFDSLDPCFSFPFLRMPQCRIDDQCFISSTDEYIEVVQQYYTYYR